MAATCTKSALIALAACYQDVPQDQRQALRIYYMAQVIQALGGTSYVGTLASTLLTDAAGVYRDVTPDWRDATNVAIWKDLTNTDGISVSSEITTVRCLRNATQDQLDQAENYLWCLFESAVYTLVNP